jgi:hypothetical protein
MYQNGLESPMGSGTREIKWGTFAMMMMIKQREIEPNPGSVVSEFSGWHGSICRPEREFFW